MLAQEKPGLGIEVDENLAAKFPIPDGPPNFRLLLGHDALARRDRHPAVGSARAAGPKRARLGVCEAVIDDSALLVLGGDGSSATTHVRQAL